MRFQEAVDLLKQRVPAGVDYDLYVSATRDASGSIDEACVLLLEDLEHCQEFSGDVGDLERVVRAGLDAAANWKLEADARAEGGASRGLGLASGEVWAGRGFPVEPPSELVEDNPETWDRA